MDALFLGAKVPKLRNVTFSPDVTVSFTVSRNTSMNTAISWSVIRSLPLSRSLIFFRSSLWSMIVTSFYLIVTYELVKIKRKP